jgi:hypothetical protein
VLIGGLDYPQAVNSSFRTAAGQAAYSISVPLYTLTTSVGVLVLPPASSGCPAGTSVTVAVVGGTTGYPYTGPGGVTFPPGEGCQLDVALSGMLEVSATVTVTYSAPPAASGKDCFVIATFGSPGPLSQWGGIASPTSGWLNAQGGMQSTSFSKVGMAIGGTAVVLAGAAGKTVALWGWGISVACDVVGYAGYLLTATTAGSEIDEAATYIATLAGSVGLPKQPVSLQSPYVLNQGDGLTIGNVSTGMASIFGHLAYTQL